MIRSMAQCLTLKFEKKPDLPGADILPILKDKASTVRGDWTQVDKLTLEKGLLEHGKDLKKLMQLFPTKNVTQVRWRVRCLVKKVESNPAPTDQDVIREALNMTVEN